MGRPKRITAGGIIYHVLNRANRRAKIFHKPGDYDAFLGILTEGSEVVPCRILGLCIMPNHWHLVLWPHRDGDLSHFMAWVTNTHVKRYRQHYQDTIGGHLYQGRFKNFPIQEDYHLSTVLRYVEANPLRAGLGVKASDWRWSSYALRNGFWSSNLSEWPVDRPADWGTLVEERWSEPEVAKLRGCVNRGCPFGEDQWVNKTAQQLGLAATLRPPGRPTVNRPENSSHP